MALQDDVLDTFPSAGVMQDFYPGFGEFETATHNVPITLGSLTETLRCSRLPGLLGTRVCQTCTHPHPDDL